MSHDIISTAWTGEVPWHGLGVRVPNDLTPEQMMKAAGLDYTVSKKRAFIDMEGERVPLENSQALVRDDTGEILTTVTDGWIPHQHRDVFSFFREFVLSGEMEMHTAGALRAGKSGIMAWMLAKMDDSFTLFEGDQVDSYLLFTNPHVYGKAITVMFTPIRVVCSNTLTMALAGLDSPAVRFTHRSEFDPKIVKKVLGLASKENDHYRWAAEKLAAVKVTRENMIEYFNSLFPAPDSKNMSLPAETCLDLVAAQPGAQYAEGTLWPAFNAVTHFVDFKYGKPKKESNDNDPHEVDRRLHASWYGHNQRLKMKALGRAISMADSL